MKRWMSTALGIATAFVVAGTAPAAGDSWSDRTTLTFSDPIMVPGATLPAGTYVFKLMDLGSNRHVVQILAEDETRVVVTTQAVPTKRLEAASDVVLRFDPTEPGTAPALRAWFYPGSLYGHQFVYPDEQARQIARRTRTIVLAGDQPGTDLEKGVLRTYRPTGERAEWHGDAATMREWDAFRRSRADASSASREERRASSAPVVQAAFEGMRVTVDQLEDGAARYTGKKVSVDAEVEDVFGPRLFTIDEPRWGDLEGEILVRVPSGLAALVREDDRVTVSGTVQQYVRADFAREWGWAGLVDPDLDARLVKRPVLVADHIVGGTSDVALVIDAGGEAPPAGQPAASPGTPRATITDTATLAAATDDAVGRRVHLRHVTAAGPATHGGFFVEGAGRSVFVLPGRDPLSDVQKGQTVTIHGVALQLPRTVDDAFDSGRDANDEIYVLATRVETGPPSSN